MSRLIPCLLALCLLACDRSTPPLRLQVVADPVEAEAYRALIRGFTAEHPDTPVALVTVGRQREHVTKLATGFASGNPPDLFLINYRRYGQFVAKDLMEPLGPRLAALGAFDAEEFYAPALEAFQVDGAQLCMPQNISSLVVYWNPALFERFGVSPPAADWTWKDFHHAARDLTRDTDADGAIDIFGLDVDPSLIQLAPFVWQAGGQIVDSVEKPTQFTLRTQEAVIGLSFLKRLRTEVGVMPPLARRRAFGPEARFAAGGVAMTLQSRRFATTLRSLPDLSWDVAPLPRYKQAATTLHADAYCLSRASQQAEAAARFVAYALGTGGQTLLARTGRIVPSRKSVARSPAFLDPELPPASAQVFLDNVEILHRLPVAPRWYEIETRLAPIIEEWMFEPAAQASREARMGLTDGYRLVTLIEAEAGPLLREPAR